VQQRDEVSAVQKRENKRERKVVAKGSSFVALCSSVRAIRVEFE